jgi:hypothetical protein
MNDTRPNLGKLLLLTSCGPVIMVKVKFPSPAYKWILFKGYQIMIQYLLSKHT